MIASTVYLETSVISYLTNPLSRDLRVTAHQQVTQDWWNSRRADFHLVVSPAVIREIENGSEDFITKRLEIVRDLTILEKVDEAVYLSKKFLEKKAFPAKAETDALHVAFAAVNGIDFLLTWNCKHIANAEIIHHISEVCEELGYESPILCTPLELSGD